MYSQSNQFAEKLVPIWIDVSVRIPRRKEPGAVDTIKPTNLCEGSEQPTYHLTRT